MSTGTRENKQETGPLQASAGEAVGVRDTAGVLYARLTALPALLVVPFLLTSFPLLLLGWFRPVPVIVAWLVLAAVIVPFGWRRIPSAAGGLGWGTPSGEGKRTPWWTLAALLAVVVGFGIDQGLYHSQFIIIWEDAASYTQFAFWIATHGSLPIPQHAAAFGGAPGIGFDSPAFYQVGHTVVPQFMAGEPLALSLGYWAHGMSGLLLMAPLLGAGAVLTFGGLAARLVGPRWGWLAALALGVSLPQEYVSRNTFSEPLSQILLLGGLALWIDSQRTSRGDADADLRQGTWRSQWRNRTNTLAFLAGLTLGINLLARIDTPSDILLAVPFCGLLVLQRRRQVAPLIAGVLIGFVYGTVDGLVLSRPYLRTNITSVVPLTVIFVLAAVVTALAVLVLRRRGGGMPRLRPRLVDVVSILPFLVLAFFVVRPFMERPAWRSVSSPLSLLWLYWYVGAPVIVGGVIAIAMLARRCLRGQAPVWVLPLLVFIWAIPEFLYRPEIAPSNPYASRRMAVAVLPGLILLSVWLSAWIVRRTRAARFAVPPVLRRVPLVAVSVVCAAALVVPAFQGMFGLGLEDGGSQGLRLASDGLGTKRLWIGEVAAMNDLCRSIPPDSSVLIVDSWLASQTMEDIRGMCGVPTAAIASPVTLAADVRAIERTGRRPVLFATRHAQVASLKDGKTKLVLNVNIETEPHKLTSPPRAVSHEGIAVYRWEPAGR